ncbi:hypothetical protein LQV63_15020 [Paenibacillus profundus]|uniref:Thiopeptide-type bacteriocin biosynthesis domain-containing protein n=2 Tax=Paenibacillus TaxID=44249 RepID=A0ABS8YFZ5_9BACL|nr:hypothetical protein [Paenibacillus profundus]
MKHFFYIRYWLGGPHIRLRFTCYREEDYAAVKDHFQQSITEFIAGNDISLIDYDSFYKDSMLQNENIEHTYWCEHGSVQEIAYIPEYDRYGGEAHIARSERIFMESSKLACSINTLDYRKRIVVGLDLIYLTFKLFDYSAEAYKHYSEIWAGYTAESNIIHLYHPVFTKRLAHLSTYDFSHKTIYDDYFLTLKENIYDQGDFALIASHIHMTNNRLGIHPEFEYMMSDFIYHDSAGSIPV